MQTKNLKKKGFTLVELVIVVAVIAVLSAILIPTIGCFVEEAKETKDVTTVKTLNSVLVEDEAKNGKPVLFRDALKIVDDKGYDVTKLTPLSTGDILWDSKNNRFALNDKDGNPVYRDNTSEDVAKIDLWKVVETVDKDGKVKPDAEMVSALSDGYSHYLKGNIFKGELQISTGLDVGDNAVSKLAYVGETSVKNVVIYTNSFETSVTVTAYENGTYGSAGYVCDSVKHYGCANEIEIIKGGFASYHENGVVGFITLNEGKLVAESGSNVVAAYIPDATKSFDVVDVNKTITDVYVANDSDVSVAANKNTDKTVEFKALTGELNTKKAEAKNEAFNNAADSGKFELEGVARVGTQTYTSLQSAIDAGKKVKDTTPVTVYKDCSYNGSISAYAINKLVILKGVTVTVTRDITYSSTIVSEPRCTLENHGSLIVTKELFTWGGKGYIINNGSISATDLKVKADGIINNGTILLNSGTSQINGNLVNNGKITAANDGVKLSVAPECKISGTGENYSDGAYVWNSQYNKFVPEAGIVENVTSGKNYLDLGDAVSVSSAGDVLKLKADLNTKTLTISKKITIDLNGHTLSYGNSIYEIGTITIEQGGDLTIKDSTATAAPVLNNDGTVTYVSGKVVSTFGVSAIMVKSGGKFTLESGTIRAESNNNAIGIYENSDPSKKLGSNNAVVNIKGGLVINANTKDVSDSDAIAIYGTATETSDFGKYSVSDPALNISGGIVWSNKGCAVIGQGTLNNTLINISGGTLYSVEQCAIYHPQYGKLTISDNAVIKGQTAICIKGGEMTINGGKLEATKTELFVPAAASGSGTAITGDAVYIEDSYNRGVIVTINGGEFKTTASGAEAYRVLFSGSNPAVVTDNRTNS